MIEVTAEYGDRLSLRVSGHADFVSEGQDPVCAAASILVYTFGQNIVSLQDASKCDYVTDFNKGDATIYCRPEKKHYEKFKLVLDFTLTGFRLLEYNFPKNIKVNLK